MLWAVDACDATGKGLLTQALRRGLMDMNGAGCVEIVTIMDFLQANEQLTNLRLALSSSQSRTDRQMMQRVFIAVWNRLMGSVGEMLASGTNVILNSSPLRSVAFYHGVDGELAEEAERRYRDGTMTRNLFPRNALLVTASSELVAKRLAMRSKEERQRSHDPVTLTEIVRRQLAYEAVFKQLYENKIGVRTWRVDVTAYDRGQDVKAGEDAYYENIVIPMLMTVPGN